MYDEDATYGREAATDLEAFLLFGVIRSTDAFGKKQQDMIKQLYSIMLWASFSAKECSFTSTYNHCSERTDSELSSADESN